MPLRQTLITAVTSNYQKMGLTRKLNTIKTDLVSAGLEIDETKSNERIIWIKKILY